MIHSVEWECYCHEKQIDKNKSPNRLPYHDMTMYFDWYNEKIKKYCRQNGILRAETKNKTIQQWLKKDVGLK